MSKNAKETIFSGLAFGAVILIVWTLIFLSYKNFQERKNSAPVQEDTIQCVEVDHFYVNNFDTYFLWDGELHNISINGTNLSEITTVCKINRTWFVEITPDDE